MRDMKQQRTVRLGKFQRELLKEINETGNANTFRSWSKIRSVRALIKHGLVEPIYFELAGWMQMPSGAERVQTGLKLTELGQQHLDSINETPVTDYADLL